MFFEHAFLPDSILLKFAYVPAFILSFYASCVEGISIFLCKRKMLVVCDSKVVCSREILLCTHIHEVVVLIVEHGIYARY